MSRVYWEPAETEYLIALRARGLPYKEIAWQLSEKFGTRRTGMACSAKYLRVIADGIVEAVLSGEQASAALPPPSPHFPPSRYDDLVEGWNNWLGRTVKSISAPQRIQQKRRRIGILCDTHCPFENRAVIAALVAGAPYDIVVVAGDVLDFLPVSPFVTERASSMEEEIQHGTWLLEVLAGCAAEVIVLTGNHGRRIMKKLDQAKLPVDLLKLLRWLEPQVDLFRLMANGLPNVHIINEERPTWDGSRVVVNFLVQLGDAIIGHPDLARKIRLKAVSEFRDWLADWSPALQLRPFRVVAQGHTHQAGIVFAHGGAEMYLELGAAVTAAGVQYALQGKCFWRPPVPAYTLLEQELVGEEWQTDFNSVRQILCRA